MPALRCADGAGLAAPQRPDPSGPLGSAAGEAVSRTGPKRTPSGIALALGTPGLSQGVGCPPPPLVLSEDVGISHFTTLIFHMAHCLGGYLPHHPHALCESRQS